MKPYGYLLIAVSVMFLFCSTSTSPEDNDNVLSHDIKIELLKRMLKVRPGTAVVMMSGHGTINTAVKATHLGAYDWLEKPLEEERLLLTLKNAIEKNRLIREKDVLFEVAKERYRMIGTSPALKIIYDLIDKIAPTNSTVVITGESGTGKELVAHAIHLNSNRSLSSFVHVNCAAIPEALLESELFGYEKGAFTGANVRKIGKFEEANGGTIFLDEIGDMSLALQAKILRVLQEFELSRLGGHKVISVDLRVIAASNQDLTELIAKKRFREDLFHRLNGVHLHVPSLKDRAEDIEELSLFFLDCFKKKYGKDIESIGTDTLDIFRKYNWPGNIRELKNCIERAVVICEGPDILPEHLPDRIHKMDINSPEGESSTLIEKMDAYRQNYMRKVIVEALRKTEGNRLEAAQLLNISRKTLYNRMKELDIKYDFA